jgi:ABC-type antimicrobial peptide transport system permease subunit
MSVGTISLILAVVGVFAVTAYSVTRRSKEIGIRMALGATQNQVVRRIVRDALVPAAIGLSVGILAAPISTRLIRSMLFDTATVDMPIFGVAVTVLAVSVCLAAYFPARRAAQIAPMEAVRRT